MTFPRRICLVVATLATSSCGSGDSPTDPPPPSPPPPVLTNLVLVSGNDQSTWPSRRLPNPIAVRAVDQQGLALAGVTVTWSITAGGGQIGQSQSITGAEGTATAEWESGRSSLDQTAEASAGSFTVQFSSSLEFTGQWESVAPLPTPVRALVATTDGTRIYVFGGSAGASPRTPLTQIYDPDQDSWTAGSPVPEAIEWSGAVFVDGTIHLLGGVTNSAAASHSHWIYDPVDDSWTSGPSLSIPAGGPAVGLVGSDLFVAGGIDGPGNHSDHMRGFDLDAQTWSTGTPVPEARINWQAAVIDGQFFVGGGSGPGRVTDTMLRRYDPTTDSWSVISALPTPTEGFAGAAVSNMYCLLGGRETPSFGSFNTPFASVDCYEPQLATWFSAPPLLTAVEEAGAIEVAGFLYVIGGRVGVFEVTGEVSRIGPQ